MVAGQSAPIVGQSRWFGTDHKKGKEDDIVVATDSEVMIERDRLILSEIKNIAKVSTRAKYHVIVFMISHTTSGSWQRRIRSIGCR
jgi:hypothetical protein